MATLHLVNNDPDVPRLTDRFVEGSPDAIVLVDEQGYVAEWNPAAEQLTGLARASALHRPIWEILADLTPAEQRQADTAARLRARVLDACRTGRASWLNCSFELELQRRDGSRRIAEQRVSPIPTEHGFLLADISRDITHALPQSGERYGRVFATERRLAEQALERRTHQLQLLHEIDHSLLAAHSLEEIAQTAITRIRSLLGCLRASLVTFDYPASQAVIVAVDTDGETQLSPGSRMPLTEFADIVAGRASQGTIVEDIGALAHPLDGDRVLYAEGMRSYVRLPLLVEGQPIGVLNLTSDGPEVCRHENLGIVRHVADSLAVVIQHARLHEQLRESHAQLQALSRHLVETQDNERRKLAGELYDNTGQQLAALTVGLQLLELAVPDNQAALARIEDLKHLASEVLSNLHTVAVNLRPASLERLGLVAAVRQYLQDFQATHGLGVDMTAVGLAGRRPARALETALFWMVQECLSNVIRHAHASEVGVILEYHGGWLKLIVEDNGIGYDPAAVQQEGHVGLITMQERAAMLNGEVAVESSPGKGTTVYVTLPWQDHAAG